MNFVKKDFKNIYETGNKDLSDIEALAIEENKKAKNDHSKKQKQIAQQSLDQLETKSGFLQVELKQYINESLKKLQDTFAVETAQNEAFLASLLVELKTLIEQMKVKLNALKQSYHENVDFARTVAAENFLANIEHTSFMLEHALSNSLQNLKSKAKGNLEGLGSNLDKEIAAIYDKIEDGTKSNLVSWKSQSDTVADHSSSLLKTLFTDSQNKLNLLEDSAHKAKNEIDSLAGLLLDVITAHANSIEGEISGVYENISATHFKDADNRLSYLADELSALHDATTEQLITVTDKLSDDLLDRSKQVQVGLHDHGNDVVKRVDNLFGSFQEKLNDRLQFSREQQHALESDKDGILLAIQNELLSIQKAFAEKIASMLDQSKIELIGMTKSVEIQMFNAAESLSEQMSDSAKAIQQQIENEVTKFLQDLLLARTAALDEISIAAKGGTEIAKNTNKYDKQENNESSKVVEFSDEAIKE